jgi:alpha-D-ribose 1-methylphosphonate 5-triphosphate synthase subunit PhnH
MPSCDTDDVRNWITFHTGAPIVPPTEAHFATGTWDEMQPLSQFRQGVPQYPDRSATLIVECDDLKNEGAMISGPGIQETRSLSLPETDAFQQNAAQFPLGVDFLFCAGTRIAGLPRTTQVSGV